MYINNICIDLIIGVINGIMYIGINGINFRRKTKVSMWDSLGIVIIPLLILRLYIKYEINTK